MPVFSGFLDIRETSGGLVAMLWRPESPDDPTAESPLHERSQLDLILPAELLFMGGSCVCLHLSALHLEPIFLPYFLPSNRMQYPRSILGPCSDINKCDSI